MIPAPPPGADEDEDDDAPWDPDEPIPLEITDVLDLHAFAPREILEVVDAYLDAAIEEGIFELRLIHGKGKGVQRARIHALLTDDPRVRHFQEAPPDRGGWGATLVALRRPEG